MHAEDFTLSAQQFRYAFPFHVLLDEALVIAQMGTGMEKLKPQLVGCSLHDVFEFERFAEPPSYEVLSALATHACVLRPQGAGLRIRGHFLPAEGGLLFLGAPLVTSIAELAGTGITLDDFPPHDATADYLFLLRARENALIESKVLSGRLKRKSAALREAKVAAEEASRAKTSFLANVSHEIRTPMNGVMGMAQLLVDSGVEGEAREYAEIIEQSASALLAVINDTLDLAKIESGKLELEVVPFAPAELAEQVRAMFSVEARQRDLELDFHIADDVPEYIAGDPGRLRQVLVNLVGNAMKFTQRGGVDVEFRAHEGPVEGLAVSVRDTGIGIPEEHVGRVFQAFQQVDPSTTRRFGGTGLGLSITQKLLEMMHGEIGVESRVGVGSHFHFWFPAPAAQPAVEAPGEVGPLRLLPGTRVLVVEDNAVNQLLARRLLERLDLEVIVADHGRDAIDLLASESVDLILMDVQMPVMDGMTATRLLRASEFECAGVPVVALTANVTVDHREACRQAGMDDFLPKPVRVAELESVLRRWLQARRAA